MSSHKSRLYAQVIVPVPVHKLFTYNVDRTHIDIIQQGSRVIVQFGKHKFHTGVVHSLSTHQPTTQELKTITAVLDETPIFTPQHLQFWQWIAEYYICPIGEVLKTALPSALRIESETRIQLHPSFHYDKLQSLSHHEKNVATALLNRQILGIKDIQTICGLKNVHHIIKNLIEQEVAIAYEEFEETFPSRTEKYIRLSNLYSDEHQLNKLIELLSKRAPRQCDAILYYLQLTKSAGSDIIRKKLMLQRCSSSIMKNLLKKQIFEEIEIDTLRSRSNEDIRAVSRQIILTDAQQAALDALVNGFQHNNVQVLWGVPSSGKTEIYFKLIEDVLKQGKQVLYLLPEIALTTQIIERVRAQFGEQALIYHHRFSPHEKIRAWLSVAEQASSVQNIVVGTRSALFLPFKNLGLIIIDEEQDPAYKQTDLNPRYHARDASVMLAKIMNARVLIGTATPSIETYFNSQIQKYGLVKLEQRYGNTVQPDVRLIDLSKEKTKARTWYISSTLLDAIKTTLDKKHQVILFQNRRGFAPMLQCRQCGWIPMCRYCDVTLTYHKKHNQIKCHMCGFSLQPPAQCAECGSSKIHYLGIGTEKIAEELAMVMPDIRISRLDADAVRKKHAYVKILQEFEQQQTQILVGTQMVSKGLDFDNVQLVGIINADNLLHYPDFRSFERAFHLLIQIIGRAGRHRHQGTVIIQTRKPSHPVLQAVLTGNIEQFYHSQLAERKQFHYPPFYRLMSISVQHRNEQKTIDAARKLKDALSDVQGMIILGPEEPFYGKIRNYYIRNILLKIPRTSEHKNMRQSLQLILQNFIDKSEPSFRFIVDVDPL